MCAFHVVHRTVLTLHIFAASIISLNQYDCCVALYKLALLLCLWCVCVCVRLCVWLPYVEEEGLVHFSRDFAMQMNIKRL